MKNGADKTLKNVKELKCKGFQILISIPYRLWHLIQIFNVLLYGSVGIEKYCMRAVSKKNNKAGTFYFKNTINTRVVNSVCEIKISIKIPVFRSYFLEGNK